MKTIAIAAMLAVVSTPSFSYFDCVSAAQESYGWLKNSTGYLRQATAALKLRDLGTAERGYQLAYSASAQSKRLINFFPSDEYAACLKSQDPDLYRAIKQTKEDNSAALKEFSDLYTKAVVNEPIVAESKAAEEAKLQKEMESMMQQQLDAEANSRSQSASAVGGIDKYAALIKATVERYMILDPTMRGKTCTIGVKLASSGFVISVDNGRGDPAVCRSGKAAVLKANQLPVPKDPAEFEKLKVFNLKIAPAI
jgi:TolA protein